MPEVKRQAHIFKHEKSLQVLLMLMLLTMLTKLFAFPRRLFVVQLFLIKSTNREIETAFWKNQWATTLLSKQHANNPYEPSKHVIFLFFDILLLYEMISNSHKSSLMYINHHYLIFKTLNYQVTVKYNRKSEERKGCKMFMKPHLN